METSQKLLNTENQVYKFSKKSAKKLSQCDPRLQRVFEEVIKHWDCTILEGHRDKGTQDEYFRTGKSKLKYPSSKHNSIPSKAVDAVPYPIDWQDTERFRAFGGFVLGVAATLGIKLRWGGDWDGDKDFKDQSFIDMPHFELVD